MTIVVTSWEHTNILPMMITSGSECYPSYQSTLRCDFASLLSDSYLRLETEFQQLELEVVERTVSFSSQTYIDALNGLVAEGQYRCTLKSGASITANATYNTLDDFQSCSLINGGFRAGALASTFNDTLVFALTGFNGRCAVFYGPTADPPQEPLEEDPLSVGGRLFYQLGNISCTLGKLHYLF